MIVSGPKPRQRGLTIEQADKLKSDYFALLDQELAEQAYQTFIEEHSEIIPREFVQNHGVHFDIALRKLAFGTDFRSDFFFLSKSSVSWNCVFIEIEKPQSRFFRANSTTIHPDFTAAVDQIKDWQRWLSHAANEAYFLESTLSMIRKPLAYNPCRMKFVLVHGRRAELQSTKERAAKIAAYEDPSLRIMSFDSLAENLRGREALYICSRANSHIKFHSTRYVDDTFLSWMDPEHIALSQELVDAISASSYRNSQRQIDGKFVSSVDYALERVTRY